MLKLGNISSCSKQDKYPCTLSFVCTFKYALSFVCTFKYALSLVCTFKYALSFVCTFKYALPFMSTLQVRFISSPFPIVSVPVRINIFVHFGRCLNLFQLIKKHTAALELNYFVFETFYLLPFLAFVIHESNSRAL